MATSVSGGNDMWSRISTRTVAAMAAGVLCTAAIAAPALADRENPGGSVDDGNLQAKAVIRVNGDVKGGGGTTSVSAPAICWWEKSTITGEGVEAIAAFFAYFGIGFDKAALEKIAEDEKESGKTFEWYQRKTSPTATKAQLEAAGCNDPSGPYKGLFIGNIIRPFEPGNPPEPIPDPVEMADVALTNIDLQAPTLSWNPKVDSLGGGTLVNLPTWFWVTNPGPAVGGDSGERSVTATAEANGQQVSVTVTAKAGTLQIASPGGAVTCSVAKARTAFAENVPEASACTLPFKRASTRYENGFPVQATVAWTASWTGTGPGVPGGVQQLDGVVLDSTTNVPVREAQTIVKKGA